MPSTQRLSLGGYVDWKGGLLFLLLRKLVGISRIRLVTPYCRKAKDPPPTPPSMETQQVCHDYGSQWVAMENQGYATIHGSTEPPKELCDYILTEIAKLRRVEVKDSPLYYIEPVWNTLLWAKIEEYVQYGINVRLFDYRTYAEATNKPIVSRSLRYKP